MGYFIVYCICFCVVLIFKSLLVSIGGVQHCIGVQAEVAAGKPKNRRGLGFIICSTAKCAKTAKDSTAMALRP